MPKWGLLAFNGSVAIVAWAAATIATRLAMVKKGLAIVAAALRCPATHVAALATRLATTAGVLAAIKKRVAIIAWAAATVATRLATVARAGLKPKNLEFVLKSGQGGGNIKMLYWGVKHGVFLFGVSKENKGNRFAKFLGKKIFAGILKE